MKKQKYLLDVRYWVFVFYSMLDVRRSMLDVHFSKQPRMDSLPQRVNAPHQATFNRRHGRHGYLYQNRYKSILCQEDEYLLELVRHIHLNPVRAGVVKSLSELDRYRWSGHGVLVGRRRRTWQDRDEIFSHFGLKKREAVRRYLKFIEDGFNMGRREDLTGGGLRRSAGGWEGDFELRRTKEYRRGDERILGDSDFVNEILELSEEEFTHKEELKRQGWDLNRIVNKVCGMLRCGS